MSFTFVTSASMIIKAGAHASSTATTSAMVLVQAADESESFVNTATRVNWTDLYSSLDDDTKYILQDAASSYGAKLLMAYDPTGYTRSEFETKLDVLQDNIDRNIKILQDDKSRKFLGAS